MYIKSQYPSPPSLPEANAHYVFFKRPDQAAWPNFTVHINPISKNGAHTDRLLYADYVRNIQDLATGLGASLEDGGLGLEGWDSGVGTESVGVDGGKEIIGIMGENSSEYITLVHACLRLAVPFALISSYSTQFELRHAVKTSKVTRLFVDQKFLHTVMPVAKEEGLTADRIHLLVEDETTKSNTVKTKSFSDIIAGVRTNKVRAVDIRSATNDTLAYLVFSSGTSGPPKAVMISHGNLIYSVGQSIVLQRAAAEVYTSPVPQNSEKLPISLAFLPLHHTFGLYLYCFRACLAPITLVILPKWDISVALAAIPKYRITSLTLIPSIVHQLVNHPEIDNVDFSSVLGAGSGAAHLPQELGEKLSKLLPVEAQFTQGYGMSECTIAAIMQPYSGMLGGTTKRIPGCTGILLPGMEARLFKNGRSIPPPEPSAPTGDDCDVNEPGELWLRSRNVALGYWNNPKASMETFVGGWLRTGDNFKADEEGNFWFADRAKDTLKVSGAQVSPVEIEECLLAHPAGIIVDATVAGVSGGRTSDEKIPRAWVVLSETGKDVSRGWGAEKVVHELHRWHHEKLSKYKWLRGGIEVIEDIPKSPSGKVLRRILQGRYEEQVKAGRKMDKVNVKL